MDKLKILLYQTFRDITAAIKAYDEIIPEVQEPTITVFWDEPPINDLCVVSGKEGGDTMPPRYADGSFRKKGKLYEYRFWNLDKQRSVYGQTKEECFNKRTQILHAPEKKKKEKEITVKQFFEEWYQTYKIPYNGISSLNDIKQRIKCICEYFGDNKPLSNINSMDCQKLINTFAEKPNSQDKLFDVLNGALENAYKNCLIKRNPCCTVIKTPYKAEAKRPLEFNEQQEIWNNISEKYRPLYFFACCTGIRIGRILELNRKDIDFERNEIVVFKKQRKGLTETYRVPFLTELFDIIPLPACGKIFNGITRNALKCHLDKLYQKLNIKNAMIHTFRHTFVSTCYFCGIDIKKLQNWAGHASFDLTLNIYTHLLNKGNSPILEYLKKLVKER